MQRRRACVVLLGLLAVFGGRARQTAIPRDTSGRSATGRPSESPSPSHQALLYVYRQGSMVGAAGYDLIFVNDEYLAALRNSNYAKREVLPGTVVFTTLSRVNRALVGWAAWASLQKKAKERLRIEVEAGRTYYVKWSVGGKMKVVDASTGEKQIRRLRPAEH